MNKFDKAYQDIVAIENLLLAWQEFLPGKKNKNDVALFQVKLMENIFLLYGELKNKSYVHGKYQAFNISDPKPRNIHKASVWDRLLHHLLYQQLYHFFGNYFIYDSHSCRLSKGTHKALYRFKYFSRKVSSNFTKPCYVLKCDIKKFFANIDHGILKNILNKYIHDQDILWLLGQVIDSFNTSATPAKGLPLGNLTSQLLVNVYMNQFDQFVKHKLKSKFYIRYADDFIFLSQNKIELENLLSKVLDFLSTELKLELHPNKVFIKTLASGVDFLGWVHFPHHKVLRTTTKRRMLKNINQSLNQQSLSSYLGMLKHGNSYGLKNKIENCYPHNPDLKA